jgi:hypothetical protein
VIIASAQYNLFATPRQFSIEKTRGYPNEDARAISPRRRVSAISDGASVSFDSAAWATILVRCYARNPQFDRGWLNRAIAKFAVLYDRESLPWMQQASFDRGSFASLLGVRYLGSGVVEVLGIGDSLAVLCDGDRIRCSFPYTSPAQFDRRPQLLSTNPVENDFLDQIKPIHWNLSACERPALLCMTDALGQWVLAHREEEPSPIAVLRRIKKLRAFRGFVTEQRQVGRLRWDDTTLLAYWRC